MDEKLQQQLYDKYPELFVEKDMGIHGSCMAWGIDCDQGWYFIIDQLCSWIQGNLEHNWHCYPKFRFTQIKEKYGTLRLYFTTECMSLEEYFKKCLEEYREHYYNCSVDSGKVVAEYAKYVEQCKEGDKNYEGAVSMAEHMSAHICEECGCYDDISSVSIRYKNAWLKTLCLDCMMTLSYW